MRQIALKQLRLNLTAEIKDLPFAVTKRGKVIFQVITSSEVQTSKGITSLKETPKGITSKPQVITSQTTEETQPIDDNDYSHSQPDILTRPTIDGYKPSTKQKDDYKKFKDVQIKTI